MAGHLEVDSAHDASTAARFFAVSLTCVCLCGVLAAVAPVRLSIAIVFLFAGPHNLSEARYFLTRMPARAGRLKPYFVCSLFGALTLAAAYAVLPRIAQWGQAGASLLLSGYAVWSTGLLLWIATLAELRSRQPPRRNWDALWPTALFAAGCTWLHPLVLPVLLAYLHPLLGLWILDREIRQSRPEWTTASRCVMVTIPVVVALIWFVPAIGPAGSQETLREASRGIGAFLLPGFSLQKLLATHAFLELIHYGVWLIAVPIASGRVWSTGFDKVPVMKVPRLRPLVRSALVVSALLVLMLWVCFAVDYSTTREVYFAVATVHVLAEIPLLLRLL